MLTDIRDFARDIRKSGEWKTPVAAASAFILCMSYLLWGMNLSADAASMAEATREAAILMDARQAEACREAGGEPLYVGEPGALSPVRKADGSIACLKG